MAAARTITLDRGPQGVVDASHEGTVFGGPVVNTYGYISGAAIPPIPWSQTPKTNFPTSLRARGLGNLFAQFEQEVVANIVLGDLAGAATPIVDRYSNLYRVQRTMSDVQLADLRTSMTTFVTDYLTWLAL